jgi:hypothetical protein
LALGAWRLAFGVWRLAFGVASSRGVAFSPGGLRLFRLEFSSTYFGRIQIPDKTSETSSCFKAQRVERFVGLRINIVTVQSVKHLSADFADGPLRGGHKLAEFSIPVAFEAFTEVGVNRDQGTPDLAYQFRVPTKLPTHNDSIYSSRELAASLKSIEIGKIIHIETK